MQTTAYCNKTKVDIRSLQGVAKIHTQASLRKGGRRNKECRMRANYAYMYAPLSKECEFPWAQDGARAGARNSTTCASIFRTASICRVEG